MPHALAVAATWVAGVAGSVGNAVAVGLGGSLAATTLGGSVANGIMALGFASGIGAGVTAWATVASVVGAVAGQKKPKVGQAASGSQLDFKVDLNAPAPLVLGRTATGGFVVHRNTDGAALKNAHVMFCTILSFGPVQSGVEKVICNGENVSFSGESYGGGPCSTGTYAGNMDLRVQLGVKPESAFPYPSVPAGSLPEWTSSHKLSGWHAAWWSLNYNQTVYAQGVPRALFVTTGPAVYDPRLDSTYSGGSGSNRSGTESTWSWSGNTNPFLQGLTWALGRYANSKRIFGAGVPVAAIDRDAFVEGANVAETNGWTIGGVVTSADRKWDALTAMLQAGGGRPMRLGGQLSCMVATPRVSLATVTGDDIVGEVSIAGTSSRRDRINTVIPRFRSEDHNWEMVAGDPVSVSTYVTEDGGKRTREIEFGLVQDKTQAAQLAAYSIVDSREFGPIVLPLKPKWLGYKPGDCLTINEPEIGLNGQKVVIRSRQFDPSTGIVTLTCWSETDAKHTYALGLSGTAPPTPGLTAVDAAFVPTPGSGSWVIAGSYLTGPDGTLPAIILTGASDAAQVAGVIVEYREDLGAGSYGPWVTNEYPASTTRIEIVGLKAGTTYQVRVRYRTVRNIENTSTGTVLGTVTTGAVVSNIESDTTAPAAPTALAATAAFSSTFLTWTSPSDTDLDKIEIWENTVNTQPNPATQASMRIGVAPGIPGAQGFFARTGLGPGVTRYYWLRAVDKAGNVSGFNATSGVSVTTATLIYDDFTSGIKPIGRGSALPTASTYSGDLFYLTTDQLLYRKNAANTGWIKTVVAADVTGTLTNSQIADLAAAKLTGQITTTQITDSAITTAKVNAGAISTAKLAASAVTANEIAAGAITTAKLAASAVTANEIAANAITSAKIAAGQVSASHIAANTITASQIAAGTITSTQIAAGTIAADRIVAASIDSARIAINGVDLANMNTGAVHGVYTASSTVGVDVASQTTMATSVLTSSGGKLLVTMVLEFENTLSTTQPIRVRLSMDGSAQFDAGFAAHATYGDNRVFQQIITGVGAGSHTFVLSMNHLSGSAGITGNTGKLIITELKKAG